MPHLTLARTSPLRRVSSIALIALTTLMTLAACGDPSPESLLASGNALAAKKDHRAAVIQYKSALQLNPALNETRLALAASLLELGNGSDAILELNKALDNKAAAARVLPLLARALVMTGDYKRVVYTYGDTTLAEPAAQAALKAHVATAWALLGDGAKAAAAAAAALAADPKSTPALLVKARMLAGSKKADEAIAVVDGVLARDAQSNEAWLLRGEILDSVKADAKGAEEAYRKSIAVDPNYLPARAALVASRFRALDLAGAREQLAELRKVAPKHPQTALFDAQLSFLENRPEEAREQIQKLLQVYPDHVGVLVLAGAIEARLGAATQAAAHFGKVLAAYPALDVARLNLAEVEIRLGQNSQALETLKPLLEADPPRPEALSLAGAAELRQGHAAAAEKHFLLAARLDPSDTRRQTAAALTRLWSGDGSAALAELQTLSEKSTDTYADEALFAARMKRGEYDAALAALDAAAKKRPGNAALSDLRGRVHLERGDVAAARLAFEEALKLDPALTPPLVKLAELDVRDGKPELASNRLQTRLAANPRDSVALLALAELKSRQGAPVEEVKKLLGEAVAAAPNDAEPRLRLISFSLRKRLLKDALSAAQEALAAQPTDARILRAAGLAQMQARDDAQAMATFRRLAAVLPTSPEPYMLLAETYKAGGRHDQAEIALNKALELDPSLAVAQMALVDLYVDTRRQRAAVEFIGRLKANKPREPIGYALEAAYHQRTKNNAGALRSLREGLAKTGSSDLAVSLFGLLLQGGNAKEAQEFASSWMSKHPQDMAVEYAIAVSEIARNEFARAEPRLARVLATQPNSAGVLNNMAWVVLQTRGQGAAAYARRAVDLAPDRPDLLDTLAQALAAEKRFGQALEAQKRAVELAPNDNGLRLTLAGIAVQAGDKALAREELVRLQSLGSAFKAQAKVADLLKAL